jgi:hypothetical protein
MGGFAKGRVFDLGLGVELLESLPFGRGRDENDDVHLKTPLIALIMI